MGNALMPRRVILSTTPESPEDRLTRKPYAVRICWSVLVLTIIFFNSGSRCSSEPPNPDVLAIQERMKSIIEEVEPSIVSLVISHNPKHKIPDALRPWELGEYAAPFVPMIRGRQSTERDKLDLADPKNVGDFTLGSGVVLNPSNGTIVTCYHLIESAKKIYVRMPGGGGSYADIVAGDSRSDLAVLRIHNPSPKLKAVKLGEVRSFDLPGSKATVTRGQWVISVAHPFASGFADGQASASWGIISNVGRKATLQPGADDQRAGYFYQCCSLIQTDARLNLGCSGGGLFNLSGELIGMSSTIAGVAGSETTGGFVIPFDSIYLGILGVLKKGQEVEYGFLGVSPGSLSLEPNRRGLIVDTVTPEGPAATGGLLPNDIIQTVNGRDLKDDTDLFYLVGGALAGNRVTLTALRGKQSKTIRVQLAKYQHPYSSIVSEKSPAFHGLRIEYSSIMVQQQVFFGPRFNNSISLNGVIVRDLEPNSRAEAVFKKLPIAQGRWLITKVNGIATTSPVDFYAAARDRQSLELTIVNAMSGGEEKTVTLP
jgi:serine protease Do